MPSFTTVTALVGVTLAAAPAASEDERQAIARAAGLGSTIYAYDRAAWVATDALREADAALAESLNGGWVVEHAERGGLVVTFYRGEGDAAQAIFTANVENVKVTATHRLDTPVPLTTAQQHLAKARVAAAAEVTARGYAPCTPGPFNTVVLPIGKQGATLVYFLSAPTGTVNPLGGHYLVIVAPGGTIAGSRPFSKSCINLMPPKLPRGATPVGMTVSSVLDPLPTEIHVYGSYAARMPLFVLAPDKRVWRVAGADIAPIAAR